MTHLTNEQIKTDIARRTPSAAAEVKDMDFQIFAAADFEEVIRQDVKTLQREKLLEGMTVLGFAFITETGELHRVE